MKNAYRLVNEEIGYYLTDWGNNPNKTTAQRDAYPYSRINREMLGNDVIKNGKDSISLLGADGWDDEYVGSVSPQTARQYWWDKEFRVHPHNRDLLRIGLFFHIDFYRTLLLILKNEWEKYLYKRLVEDGLDYGTKEMELPKNTTDTNEYIVEFAGDIHKNLDVDQLFKLFRSHNNYAKNNGHNKDMFVSLINAMFISKLPLHSLDSEEVERFIIKCINEMRLVDKGGEKFKDDYMALRQEWTTLKNSIENCLLRQQRILERNYKTRAEWAKLFGEYEIKIKSLQEEKEELNGIINLKESDDKSLSYKKVKALAVESIKKRKKQLEEEREKIKWMLSCSKMLDQKEAIAAMFAGSIPSAAQIEYSNKMASIYKKTLREIYHITHPDATKKKEFTEEQKKQLTNIFKELVDLKEQEGITMEESMPILNELYRKANKIWKKMGLDSYDFDTDIMSGTPEELVKKLKVSILDMEEKETQIKNDIYVLLNDEDINEKEIKLASPQAIEKEEDWYSDEIKKLGKEVSEAKKDVNRLFKEIIYK